MFRVLLVCTGNTCRSAMAEGLLERLLGGPPPAGIEVSSAGTAALAGLPASAEAVEVCREVGADLTRHHSRRLTPGLLADSDLVLVMEERHREAALELLPGAAGKIHLLAEFAGGPPEPVADPIGGGTSLYRRTRALLERLLASALPRIRDLAARAAPGAGEPAGAPIEIGSDHRGFALKEALGRALTERGRRVTDRGCPDAGSCDYPDVAFAVARAVAASPGTLGVLLCGSGIGMSIAANKVPGVRAALCLTPEMARLSRRHNDANVLVLGADLVAPEENRRILDAWLETGFEGGRHARRVGKITEAELAAAPAAARGGTSDG
jgi:ribose 5-phosphate isomerase B